MNHDRIKALFIGALDRTGAAREAFLAEQCRDDAELRARVESLLAAHEARAATIDPPTPHLLSSLKTPGVATIVEGPGSRIGPYKLLQRIGEGGFGVVYMAEQDASIRRRVALKIIKLGMDTRQVVARFEQERQALAMMDHPNIARVFDAGATESGRPYFVMELVRGVPITSYCDSANLTARERLELFIPVCNAIQHAHHKGIIHRDIKPSNILVTLHDGTPVPKVIDFGIAKATEARLTERTLFTELRQMIGTPAYMSPEQAEMSGLDIDTRTDVYSLGVLLYELLTGTTPFEGSALLAAGYGEMQRMIREVEPPKPSTRVSTLGEALATTAARRKTEPSKLGLLLRGDLDWIAMKAMEKNRTRRYETANAFAADVQRHLAGDAVVAAPPSASYRLRKFVRRNRGPVITGAAVVATLLVGIAGTTLALQRAIRAERTTAETLVKVDQERDAAEWSASVANLNSAQIEMNAGEWAKARQRLAECPESKRGWEWQLLSNKARTVITQFRGSAWLSPDGSLVLTGDGDTARLWDLEGNPKGPPMKHDNVVRSAVFSPDGRVVLTASSDSTARLWDLDGNPKGPPIKHDNVVRSAVFSPDGRMVLTASDDGTARLWDLDGNPKGPPLKHDNVVRSAVFSPDGRVVLTASLDSTARLWDLEGNPKGQPMKHDGWVTSAVFSPNGRMVLTAPRDGTARLWDLEGNPNGPPMKHDSWVTSAVFSPDGRVVLTASLDSTARLWDLEGNPKGPPMKHDGWITSAVFSPDGRMVLTASDDSTARLWDLEGNPKGPPMKHDNGVTSAVFSPDGRMVLTASQDNTARLWDLASLVDIERPIAPGMRVDLAIEAELNSWHNASIQSTMPAGSPTPPVSLSSEGRVVVAPDAPQRLKQSTLAHLDARLSAVAVSPDGARVLTGEDNGAVRSWDLYTGREVLVLRSTLVGLYGTVIAAAPVAALKVTPDGSRAIARRRDGSVTVYDARPAADQAADIDRRSAERVPAKAYLEALWAGPIPTTSLEAAIIADTTQTPLRRLVAAELLDERLKLHGVAVATAFNELTAREILPERVRSAVAAFAKPLPTRVRLDVEARAVEWKPDADTLNSLAWNAVLKPGMEPHRAQAAVAAAREAVRLKPTSAAYQNTLGVALYRGGEFAEALPALERSVTLSGKLEVTDAAFLAMTKFRLGRLEDARADLARLGSLMQALGGNADVQSQAFRAEATSLIDGPTDAPTPREDVRP